MRLASFRSSALLFFTSLSSAFAADIDLTGSIASATTITTDPVTQNKSISFRIRVKNVGSDTFSGSIAIKPFMIAADQVGALDDDLNGFVLRTLQSPAVTLDSDESAEFAYTSKLPLLRRANYHVSAFINNNNAIAETSTVDNLTDLVAAGNFGVERADAISQNFDLYSRFAGDITPYSGGLQTYLRTIVRGNVSHFPSPTVDSRKLWARFLLADLTTKKVHTLPYFNYGGSPHADCRTVGDVVDKNWFAVAYATERDRNGTPVYVDYYHQAPCYADTPPGNYLLLTLMNSREFVPEADHANNLDVQRLKLDQAAVDTLNKAVWIVKTPANPAGTASFAFHANYIRNANWTVDFSGVDGLASSVTSGILGGMSNTPATYGQTLALTWSGGSNQRGNLNLRFADPTSTQSYPVRLFDYTNGTVPTASVASTTASVNVSQQEAPATGSFVITNTGSVPVAWMATPRNQWVEVSQSEGTIPAGGSATLGFTVHQSSLSPRSAAAAVIDLLTSTADSSRPLTVNLVWR